MKKKKERQFGFYNHVTIYTYKELQKKYYKPTGTLEVDNEVLTDEELAKAADVMREEGKKLYGKA